MSITSEYTTELRYQDVVRKARFGHREWIWWKDKEGRRCASLLTADAMKRCLLDVGTQGNWSLLCSDGTSMKGYFWLGIYRELVAKFRAAWDMRYASATQEKRSGYVPPAVFQRYLDGQNWMQSFLKARSLRTHAGRNKRLIALTEALCK